MTASTDPVATGTVTFFMDVKAVHCIRLESLDLTGNQNLASLLGELDNATDGIPFCCHQLRGG